MKKEDLTHSEEYVQKTNRVILIIGLVSLLLFAFGVFLLSTSVDSVPEEEFVMEGSDSGLGAFTPEIVKDNIEFNDITDIGDAITMDPNPVPMGKVVLGTKAINVLTIGTNGRAAISIKSVELADPPATGFVFKDFCSGQSLSGEKTCDISMSWNPEEAGNVQNNFIVSWYETNVGKKTLKSAKIPVIGNAITKEEAAALVDKKNVTKKTSYAKRYAYGPNGEIIGEID